MQSPYNELNLIESQQYTPENKRKKQHPSAVFSPKAFFALFIFKDQLLYLSDISTVPFHVLSFSSKLKISKAPKDPFKVFKVIR